MLIILEGCDNTGKSTFAVAAAARVGAMVQHFGPPKDAFAEYMDALYDYEHNGKHVIFDRFHLGEEVYGPLYRGGSQLKVAQLYAIEDRINRLGGVLVHLTHAPQEIQRRHKLEGEKFLVHDHIETVLMEFWSVFERSRIRLKTSFCDPTDQDIDFIIEVARLGEKVGR